MKTFKIICLTIIELLKQLWHMPQTLKQVAEQKQRQIVANKHNAERLDRIRNPSKYLGK
jgi:hypothetical protein